MPCDIVLISVISIANCYAIFEIPFTNRPHRASINPPWQAHSHYHAEANLCMATVWIRCPFRLCGHIGNLLNPLNNTKCGNSNVLNVANVIFLLGWPLSHHKHVVQPFSNHCSTKRRDIGNRAHLYVCFVLTDYPIRYGCPRVHVL